MVPFNESIPMVKRKIQLCFSDSVAVILFFFAIVNLIAASSSIPILDQSDLILPWSSRWVLGIWAALDLGVSAWLLAGGDPQIKLWLIACLTTSYLAYQIGLWLMAAPNFSECLGNLYDQFTVSPRMLGAIMKLSLGFSLIGSYAFLILHWQASRNGRSNPAAVANNPAAPNSKVKPYGSA
jgi:hypothetical protein